jgi:hypothetical protein
MKLKPAHKQVLAISHPFFLSVHFDCSKDNKKICEEEYGIISLPTLKLFTPDNKNGKVFDLSGQTPLEDQIREHYKDKLEERLRKLTNLELPYALGEAKRKNKFLLINIYKDETAKVYKEEDKLLNALNLNEKNILTHELLSLNEEVAKHFVFYNFENPNDEIIRQHKIPRVPGLYIFYEKDGKIATLPLARNIYYSSILAIANNIIHFKTFKKIRKLFEYETIPQIKTNMQFKRDCLDFDNCVLIFMDVKVDNNNTLIGNDRFHDILDKVERIRQKRGDELKQVKFNWINATCHTSLKEHFGVNDLPAIVYYHRWKNFYSLYSGFWDYYPINDYFEKVVQNRVAAKEIPRSVVKIKDNQCTRDDNEEEDDEEEEEEKEEVKKVEVELKEDSTKKETPPENKKEDTHKNDNDEKIEL